MAAELSLYHRGVQMDRVGHFVRIRITVGGVPCRFLFDTGIGVNVVSPALAERIGLATVGETFAGQRMSGQRVEVELMYLPPITIGEHVLADQVAGVAELGPEKGPDGFSGILGLSAMSDVAVTVDSRSSTFTMGELGPTGLRVPLDVRRRGPSTVAYADLVLPDGQHVCVEVDTGSGCLILDAGYLDRGEVTTLDGLETTEGEDETGSAWVRRLGRLRGNIHLAGAPQSQQADPRVLFQEIIHAGLVGAEYLDRFRYTVDVPGQQLVLEPW